MQLIKYINNKQTKKKNIIHKTATLHLTIDIKVHTVTHEVNILRAFILQFFFLVFNFKFYFFELAQIVFLNI